MVEIRDCLIQANKSGELGSEIFDLGERLGTFEAAWGSVWGLGASRTLGERPGASRGVRGSVRGYQRARLPVGPAMSIRGRVQERCGWPGERPGVSKNASTISLVF